MKTIKNKKELVELTTPLFLQHGYKNLTMNDIAKELSISKKTIYKYFVTKEALVSASIDYNLAYFDHIYDYTEANSENSVEQIKLFFKIVEKEFGFQQFRTNFIEMASSFPSMFDKASEMLKNTSQNLTIKVMERARKEGLLDENIDTETMSHLIALLYVKLCISFNSEKLSDYYKKLNEFVFLLFKSILNEKGMALVKEKEQYVSTEE